MRSPATRSTITVEDSKITLDQPVAKIDSLKNPTISGTIVPARSGVEVQIDVQAFWHVPERRQRRRPTRRADSQLSLSYGKGSLATYRIRGSYKAPNRDRWEVSSSETFSADSGDQCGRHPDNLRRGGDRRTTRAAPSARPSSARSR